MQVDTINVVTVMEGELSLVSFLRTPEGEKEAEELFAQIIKEDSPKPLTDSEIQALINEGEWINDANTKVCLQYSRTPKKDEGTVLSFALTDSERKPYTVIGVYTEDSEVVLANLLAKDGTKAALQFFKESTARQEGCKVVAVIEGHHLDMLFAGAVGKNGGSIYFDSGLISYSKLQEHLKEIKK